MSAGSDTQNQTAELPTSVPWEAVEDQPHYIAKLWLEAGKRRREASRLQAIMLETTAEVERIEALARSLKVELANGQ